MDIYSYLKSDHLQVKREMEKMSDTASHLERRTLYNTIRELLTEHTVAEEVTFYQLLTESGNAQLQQKMKYAELEHDDIAHFLKMLDITDVTCDKWLIIFGQLQYCVERHMEREEGEIFDAAQKVISEIQAINLVDAIIRVKQQSTFRKAA